MKFSRIFPPLFVVLAVIAAFNGSWVIATIAVFAAVESSSRWRGLEALEKDVADLRHD